MTTRRGQGTAGSGLDLLPEDVGDPTAQLEVTSSAFDDGDLLDGRFCRRGENVSPPLEWSTPPDGTAEVAVICEDPDAPRGTFAHWVLAGVDPSVTSLEEGREPVATAIGRNDFGNLGWDGPDPPNGDAPHRYVFTVIATEKPLELETGFGPSDLRDALETQRRAAGQLVARYGAGDRP